nr:lasso peptide biosynthesis B2 protein [uncultured Brevundimonas sp.]
MPVTLWSAPNIFMTRVYEDIVVLDTKADRYECLVDAAAWLDVGHDGRLNVSDQPMARQLIEAGLASDHRQPPRPKLLSPHCAVKPSQPRSRSDMLRAGLILASATAAFRSRSLQELIASQRQATASSTPPDELRLSELVGAARTVAPFIPMEGECLQRAYLLRRLLWREGFEPRWIFGVRTWPFGAHCWLQIDDLIVGDTLDRVGFYTPIMAA